MQVMDTYIKINNQTIGKDKIARLFQYSSRILWHKLQQSNKEGVNGFKNIEFQLSTFRKLLRLGKFIEVIYSALPLLEQKDITIQYTSLLSKICSSIFLFADHILWFARADVCAVDTAKWSKVSNNYWMYSIIFNLLRDIHELYLISKFHNVLPETGVQKFEDIYKVLIKLIRVLSLNKNIVIDTIKNTCDLFIPMNALGHSKLSAGTIGWLGVISSLAGILVLIEPAMKL